MYFSSDELQPIVCCYLQRYMPGNEKLSWEIQVFTLFLRYMWFLSAHPLLLLSTRRRECKDTTCPQDFQAFSTGFFPRQYEEIL